MRNIRPGRFNPIRLRDYYGVCHLLVGGVAIRAATGDEAGVGWSDP